MISTYQGVPYFQASQNSQMLSARVVNTHLYSGLSICFHLNGKVPLFVSKQSIGNGSQDCLRVYTSLFHHMLLFPLCPPQITTPLSTKVGLKKIEPDLFELSITVVMTGHSAFSLCFLFSKLINTSFTARTNPPRRELPASRSIFC